MAGDCTAEVPLALRQPARVEAHRRDGTQKVLLSYLAADGVTLSTGKKDHEERGPHLPRETADTALLRLREGGAARPLARPP